MQEPQLDLERGFFPNVRVKLRRHVLLISLTRSRLNQALHLHPPGIRTVHGLAVGARVQASRTSSGSGSYRGPIGIEVVSLVEHGLNDLVDQRLIHDATS